MSASTSLRRRGSAVQIVSMPPGSLKMTNRLAAGRFAVAPAVVGCVVAAAERVKDRQAAAEIPLRKVRRENVDMISR